MQDEWIMKICSIGSYQVGKTSLVRRYSENKFSSNYLPTLGVDVTVKRITLDNRKIRLVLMDTAGQEQFGNLRNVYFQGSSGCIAVYDITRRESFEALNKW
ncbi:MAG: Rab family GTPase, partial [Candidatus Hodarchaeales archaeon]